MVTDLDSKKQGMNDPINADFPIDKYLKLVGDCI